MQIECIPRTDDFKTNRKRHKQGQITPIVSASREYLRLEVTNTARPDFSIPLLTQGTLRRNAVGLRHRAMLGSLRTGYRS